MSLLLLAYSFLAQTPAPLEFGVASIRPSATSPQGKVDIGIHIDGAQIRCISFSLKDYLGMAYRVKAQQIEGPEWLTSERFDVVATMPEGTTAGRLAELFQTLLADRFQVKVHTEKKEFPVYVLTVGNASKLKEAPSVPENDSEPAGTVSAAGTGSANGIGVNLGHGASYSFADHKFRATKLTMAQVAENLEPFANRPIIDRTGLTGRYDLVLDFTPEDFRAMMVRGAIVRGVILPPEALRALEGSSDAAIGDALQQTGLRLEARKAPLDVLVIDRVSKTPTEN